VHRAGGLGWQLGDEGSGYALARAALGVAGRALDGRGRASDLTDAVLAGAGVGDLAGLVRWAATASRTQVAALASNVALAAQRGDPAARELVDAAAADLVALVVALLARIGTPAPGQIALSGGLLNPGSPVRDSLVGTLSRAAPQLTLSGSVLDPALGAARLALRL
jgi:N-acetylglucosamine kinase-like BadF-type ATPase